MKRCNWNIDYALTIQKQNFIKTQDIADYLNVSLETYYKYRYTRLIPYDKLILLSEYLKVDINLLLKV